MTQKDPIMSEIEPGDLVRWQSGEKVRVGVVRSVNDDNTCTIDMTTRAGRFEEKIRTTRLERITSTVKPAQNME
jgi:hypothetical protein